MKLTIIDYGAGNIKSLQFAFKRLGVEACLSADPDEILKADKVIFPGVGEASSAMNKLRENQLDQVIPELRVPVLGICLGMQLLCKSSEENNTQGLAVFDTRVKRFPTTVKVPQMGWNTISGLSSDLFSGIEECTYMYAVHGYYAEASAQAIAVSDYGLPYTAALKKDNFYGVQFHPEKSSEQGERVLHNFLNL